MWKSCARSYKKNVVGTETGGLGFPADLIRKFFRLASISYARREGGNKEGGKTRTGDRCRSQSDMR